MTNTRALALFALVSAALIAGSGALLGMFFTGPGERNALLASAALAFAVQLGTFALARPAAAKDAVPGDLLMRWGVGAVTRLLTLLFYGLIATKIMQMPAAASMISLATFFFVTMIAEPLLLNK